jgi:hypothetical protein
MFVNFKFEWQALTLRLQPPRSVLAAWQFRRRRHSRHYFSVYPFEQFRDTV